MSEKIKKKLIEHRPNLVHQAVFGSRNDGGFVFELPDLFADFFPDVVIFDQGFLVLKMDEFQDIPLFFEGAVNDDQLLDNLVDEVRIVNTILFFVLLQGFENR